MTRRRGFTIIEVLVVVAIIALLVAILVPFLSSSRRNALRSSCAVNIHAQLVAVSTYAAMNKDWFPASYANGNNWYWDESNSWSDLMLQVVEGANVANQQNLSSLSIKKVFYCPANKAQNADVMWTQFSNGGATDGFRMMGYGWLNDRTEGGGFHGALPSNAALQSDSPPYKQNPTLQYYVRMGQVGSVSSTEMVFDCVVCQTSNSDFADPLSALGSPAIQPTNHLTGSKPDGMNVGYLDGHAEWHNYNANDTQNTAKVPTGGATWWIILK